MPCRNLWALWHGDTWQSAAFILSLFAVVIFATQALEWYIFR